MRDLLGVRRDRTGGGQRAGVDPGGLGFAVRRYRPLAQREAAGFPLLERGVPTQVAR